MGRRTSARSFGPTAALLVMLAVMALAVAVTLRSGDGVRAAPPAQHTVPGPILTAEAQITPTPEATLSPNVKTVVRLETDQVDKVIPQGQEFEVRVMVDSVEHLAGFAVTIGYDPKRLQPVLFAGSSATPGSTPIAATPSTSTLKSRALGQFLASSGRQGDLVCAARADSGSTVTINCNLFGLPLCLGGAPGVSGSGLLGAIYFKARGGGTTTLTLKNTTGLALDDFADCNAAVTGAQAGLPGECLPFRQAARAGATELSCKPDGTAARVVEGPVDAEGQTWVRLENLGWAPADFLEVQGGVPTIPHRLQDATVKLASSGGTSTLLIVIVVVVVVVAAAGGAGGYLWYRRRQTARPPSGAS